MGPVLTVGQCFGIMPVIGILEKNASALRFSYSSWRMCYTIINIAASTIMNCLCVLHIILTGLDIRKTVRMMFYVSTWLALVLFLRLAPLWPSLGGAVAAAERPPPSCISSSRGILHLQAPRKTKVFTLRVKMCLCCFVVLLLALVEHLMSIVAETVTSNVCQSSQPSAKSYFVNVFPQIFHFTEFNCWKAAIVGFVNISSTFNWNFMDLFIIVVSLGLTERFEILNERLDAIIGQNLPPQYWRARRQEFSELSHLVRRVDKAINEIVLLSFANNLYFICFQLFNSLKPLRGLSHAIYFGFSFSFLMGRSLAVSLSAASLHSAARKPAAVLFAVPSASYCVEVLRFVEQVTSDIVALTGLNFFYVTKGLVLTIAGTVVTYELVLVQFNNMPQGVRLNITSQDVCELTTKT